MSLLTKEINIFFSSSESSGATDVSPDGSRFSVFLDNPIKIPASVVDCSLSVVQAQIWNTSPNIAQEYNNNTFSFTTSDAGNAGTHTIEISDGLYSLSDLNGFISVALLNLSLPSNLITISGLPSTGQSYLTFQLVGDSVNFNTNTSVRTILGFDYGIYTATISTKSIYSQGVAKFNRNNSYLITSDIISGGIPINSISPNVIASVPINVPPGSQINYVPFNTSEVDAMSLVGLSKSNISFTLLNQDLQSVSTQNETYSILIRIKYVIKI